MLFYAEDMKKFGMNKLLEPFVDEINHLFNVGIELKYNCYNLSKIKFIFCHLLLIGLPYFFKSKSGHHQK